MANLPIEWNLTKYTYIFSHQFNCLFFCVAACLFVWFVWLVKNWFDHSMSHFHGTHISNWKLGTVITFGKLSIYRKWLDHLTRRDMNHLMSSIVRKQVQHTTAQSLMWDIHGRHAWNCISRRNTLQRSQSTFNDGLNEKQTNDRDLRFIV